MRKKKIVQIYNSYNENGSHLGRALLARHSLMMYRHLGWYLGISGQLTKIIYVAWTTEAEERAITISRAGRKSFKVNTVFISGLNVKD